MVVDAQPRSAAVITESGDRTDALPDTDSADFAAAVSRNDVAVVVEIAARSLTVEVELVVINHAEATGRHWLRSANDLRELLTGPRWAITVRALASGPSSLLIDDARSGMLRTQALSIYGPDADASTCPDRSQAATSREGNRFPRLPSPHLVSRPQVTGDASPELEPLVPVLHATARRLVWAQLATAAHLNASGAVRLTLSGARIVEFSIDPSVEVSNANEDIDLFEWTFGADDPARYDAAVHAATLAILDARDLETAAKPTLRTARSLYATSRSGAIAESLATRRSAREAVANATQSGSSQKRV